MTTPKVVVLLSGGLDSTTLLYAAKHEGYTPVALSADYGQRHKVELEFALWTTKSLGYDHHFVDLAGVDHLLRGQSALTGQEHLPTGHYTAENMKQTVVPNRNAIMLTLAYALAVKVKAVKVCTAVHAGDHAIYPDCRPEFIKAFEEMQRTAITREIYDMKCPDLWAPFVNMSKADIVKYGSEIGVPYENTWSCYAGDEVVGHCSTCGTCVERIGAFNTAGVPDPTKYRDKEAGIQILRNHNEWIEENARS